MECILAQPVEVALATLGLFNNVTSEAFAGGFCMAARSEIHAGPL